MCLLLGSSLNLYLNGCGLPPPFPILVSTMRWKEESYYPYLTFFLCISPFLHSTGQQQEMFSLSCEQECPLHNTGTLDSILWIVSFTMQNLNITKGVINIKFECEQCFFFPLFMWLLAKFLFFQTKASCSSW